jgi:8-hydroxy-5-deazaflavin:NADPH oxidoreductase
MRGMTNSDAEDHAHGHHIIGTGNMARGIATRALAGGHTVTLHGRQATSARQLAGELSGDVRAGASGDPLARDIVVLALPYGAIDDVLSAYRA